MERLGEPPETEPVTIHGDANLGNAVLLDDGRVALLDLEHLALGPAAADVGQVVANALVGGDVGEAVPGRVRPDRPRGARLVHVGSLLARVALPAVSRVREDLLPRLVRLL